MIVCGDCLEEMKKFPDNHFSAIVTDPPYGLSFMGKGWDYEVPGVEYWRECLRISKPGSYLLAMGGSRTGHRTASAIEASGYEIRDTIMWLYGSGFPKSHNHFGLEGYGTALKPAYEPIIMAMKPLDGTFKQNAEKWGQAGINIEECRINFQSEKEAKKHAGEWNRNWTGTPIHAFDKAIGNYPGTKKEIGDGPKPQKGRWPANVILDEEAAYLLDQQSGVSKSIGGRSGNTKAYCGGFKQEYYDDLKPGLGDSGGASRFFYCAKASYGERNEGLSVFEDKPSYMVENGSKSSGLNGERYERKTIHKNHHPTVKPLKLMEYLIKLVMPPKDGLLLDPFAGSGTTILAAKRLGFDAIGIEKSEEYCEIARARCREKDLSQLDLFA